MYSRTFLTLAVTKTAAAFQTTDSGPDASDFPKVLDFRSDLVKSTKPSEYASSLFCYNGAGAQAAVAKIKASKPKADGLPPSEEPTVKSNFENNKLNKLIQSRAEENLKLAQEDDVAKHTEVKKKSTEAVEAIQNYYQAKCDDLINAGNTEATQTSLKKKDDAVAAVAQAVTAAVASSAALQTAVVAYQTVVVGLGRSGGVDSAMAGKATKCDTERRIRELEIKAEEDAVKVAVEKLTAAVDAAIAKKVAVTESEKEKSHADITAAVNAAIGERDAKGAKSAKTGSRLEGDKSIVEAVAAARAEPSDGSKKRADQAKEDAEKAQKDVSDKADTAFLVEKAKFQPFASETFEALTTYRDGAPHWVDKTKLQSYIEATDKLLMDPKNVNRKQCAQRVFDFERVRKAFTEALKVPDAVKELETMAQTTAEKIKDKEDKDKFKPFIFPHNIEALVDAARWAAWSASQVTQYRRTIGVKDAPLAQAIKFAAASVGFASVASSLADLIPEGEVQYPPVAQVKKNGLKEAKEIPYGGATDENDVPVRLQRCMPLQQQLLVADLMVFTAKKELTEANNDFTRDNQNEKNAKGLEAAEKKHNDAVVTYERIKAKAAEAVASAKKAFTEADHAIQVACAASSRSMMAAVGLSGVSAALAAALAHKFGATQEQTAQAAAAGAALGGAVGVTDRFGGLVNSIRTPNFSSWFSRFKRN